MSALKVMIFESDRVFAESLKRAFTRRGCSVRLVDDGQIGIDLAPTDPPDLIVVAVELPRMSGFAVCNKLKKVPELKDVPIIITSSESSQETFDHHAKLRTRAEDYVHKPCSPEELIRRCGAFVHIPEESSGGDTEEVDFDDLEAVPLPDDPAPVATDAELDNIADVAFDNIILPNEAPGQPAPVPMKVPTGAMPQAPALGAVPAPGAALDDLDDLTMVASSRSIADLQLAMRATPRPQPAATGQGPMGTTIAAETERLQARVVELEGQLAAARADAVAREALQAENMRLRAQLEELPRLRAQAEDASKLQRELDDLRARTARPAGSATSTATSREGLELRETLHRKDKEIIQLQRVAHERDKEILQLRETLLQRDLERADLDERLIEREREKADLEERLTNLTQEHESLERSRAELLASFEQVKRDLTAAREAHARELERAKAERDAMVLAHEKALADVKADQERAVAALRAEQVRVVTEHEARYRDAQAAHAKALTELEARGRKAHEEHVKAIAELEARHAEARTRFEGELAKEREAHATVVAGLRAEHEASLAEAKKAHEASLAEAKKAHEASLAEAKKAHEKALAEAKAAHAREVEELRANAAAAAEAAAAALAKHEAEVKALRDAHAALEAAAARTQSDLEGRIAALSAERDEAARRGEQLARELEQTRGELQRARVLATRNAALLERARRAALIAAGLVEETARPLDEGASVGNAE